MATSTMPRAPTGGGVADIAQLLASLGPLFGSGRSTQTTKSTADPESLAQADQLLQQILRSTSGPEMDAMVGNILNRAKQTFGPAAIASNAAGMRGYSDTVLAQSRSEAMARATGEAAAARLNAINAANQQATALVSAKIRATTSQTTQARTQASPLGKAMSMIGPAALIYKQFGKDIKKAFEPKPDNTTYPMQDFGTDADFTSDVGGYSAPTEADFGGGEGVAEGFDSASIGSSSGSAEILEETINPPVDIVEDAPIGEGDTGGESMDTSTATSGAASSFAPGTVDFEPTQFSMPPAVPVDPSTGMPYQMPVPTVDPEMLNAMDSAEAIDAIPADVDFATTSTTSSMDISPGMNAGTFSAGMRAAQGDERGAVGAYFGGAVGNYFGGPIGGAIGSTIGGEVAGPVLAETEDFWMDIDDSGGMLGQSDPISLWTSENVSLGDKIDAQADPLGNMIGLPGPGDLLEDLDMIGGGSGCYITTAATNGGETDNGYLLTKLREFRQLHMQTPEGHSDLLDYMLLAPIIVKRVSESANADNIWEFVREKFLKPAVFLYEQGLPQETYLAYKDMMYWLRQQVGLANPQGALNG